MRLGLGHACNARNSPPEMRLRVWSGGTRVQSPPHKEIGVEGKKNSPQALQTVLPSGSRLHRGLSVTPQFEQRGWFGDRTPEEKFKSSASSTRPPLSDKKLIILRDRYTLEAAPFGFRVCSEGLNCCIRAICKLRDAGSSTREDMDRKMRKELLIKSR